MKALVLTEHGPPEVLQLLDRPDPRPGPDEVAVAVRCAGVNFADVLARLGLYPDAPPPPCIIGYEFSGEIVEAGASVTRFGVGDQVMGACRFGGYSEVVCTAAAEVQPLPDGWTHAEGTALPGNYTTAYAALVRYGSIRAGERLLVHSAGGGVGIAAAQIGLASGAEVVGIASGWKHDALLSMGLTRVVDSRSDDLVGELRAMFGQEEPFDLVLDTLGGQSPLRSYSLMRAGGRLVCVGSADLVAGERRDSARVREMVRSTARFSAQRLMLESKSVIGLNLLRLGDVLGSTAEYLRELQPWIGSGSIRPVIAAAYPLAEGAAAHRFLQERRNLGKVVLSVTDGTE